MRKEKRLENRNEVRLILKAKDCNTPGKEYVAKSLNVSEAGACLLAECEFKVGTLVKLRGVLDQPFGPFNTDAKIKWEATTREGKLYGIQFVNPGNETRHQIRNYFNRTLNKGIFKKNLLHHFLMFTMTVFLGLAAVFLIFLGDKQGSFFFVTLLVFLALERVWETFYTGQENMATCLSEDWSMTAASFYYAIMMVLALIEYCLVDRGLNIFLLVFSFSTLLISFVLRWWGMITLKDQWRVNAVKTSLAKRELILSGPYRYLRHPIYLGVVLELISIPLIVGAFFTLIFVLLVNVPLQILRSQLEERKLIEIFGKDYLDYMNLTPGFFPNFPLYIQFRRNR